jgi:hypothetical protein
MKTYDLYGARNTSAEELARVLQSALGLPFEPRRSDFIGDYYRAAIGDERFSVEPNHQYERRLEAKSADCAVLLYVDRTERAEDLEFVLVTIPGLEFLRRRTVEERSIHTVYER